jgi:hypothetical protein
MATDYTDVIREASAVLVPTIREEVRAGGGDVRDLDALVLELCRKVGREALRTAVVAEAEQSVKECADRGFRMEADRDIEVNTILGPLCVAAPVMRSRAGREVCRPVQRRLGIHHKMKTRALERAMTDFGGNESFERAVKRLKEHYSIEMGRTTMLRVVEGCAEDAATFVEEKLATAEALYDLPEAERPGVDEMLAELDGCEIRTGTLVAAKGRTPTGRRKRTRETAWRDVRMGLVRLPGQESAAYVGRMDEYSEVVSRLFRLGILNGLGPLTSTVGIGDGGIGLMESMADAFPNFRFILDYYHLAEHVHGAAAAAGLAEPEQAAWVERVMKKATGGRPAAIIKELGDYVGTGEKEVRNLAAYIKRFRQCIHYEKYQSEGLPIGSGEVESAHRTIPQRRLKLPGTWWHPTRINSMLALLILHPNGWWEEFWTWRRSRTQRAAA